MSILARYAIFSLWCGIPSLVSAQSVVVPNAWAGAEGPSNSTIPFGFSSGQGRFQEVYGAPDLSGLPLPCWVTGIEFRPNQNSSLTARTLVAAVKLSTPVNGPDQLSSTFADNVGADEVEGFSGSIALPDVPGGPGPTPFAWTIPLTRPFRYEGQGILLDITIHSSTGGSSGASLDAVNVAGDPVSRVYNSSDPNDPKGSPGTLGLVTQFQFQPWTSLYCSLASVSAAAGGKAEFTLDAGVANAGRTYLILGTASGTSPGWPLGSVVVPINPDCVTFRFLRALHSPTFTDFLGDLDPLGRATASAQSLGPLDPALVGTTFHFAYLVGRPVDFASNAVGIQVLP